MYHVALVNFTDREILYAEEYEDKDRAEMRVRFGLGPQAEANTLGLGSDPENEKDKEWKAYLGEEPFAFPEEAP